MHGPDRKRNDDGICESLNLLEHNPIPNVGYVSFRIIGRFNMLLQKIHELDQQSQGFDVGIFPTRVRNFSYVEKRPD